MWLNSEWTVAIPSTLDDAPVTAKPTLLSLTQSIIPSLVTLLRELSIVTLPIRLLEAIDLVGFGSLFGLSISTTGYKSWTFCLNLSEENSLTVGDTLPIRHVR